jgi:hypothetical protein
MSLSAWRNDSRPIVTAGRSAFQWLRKASRSHPSAGAKRGHAERPSTRLGDQRLEQIEEDRLDHELYPRAARVPPSGVAANARCARLQDYLTFAKASAQERRARSRQSRHAAAPEGHLGADSRQLAQPLAIQSPRLGHSHSSVRAAPLYRNAVTAFNVTRSSGPNCERRAFIPHSRLPGTCRCPHGTRRALRQLDAHRVDALFESVRVVAVFASRSGGSSCRRGASSDGPARDAFGSRQAQSSLSHPRHGSAASARRAALASSTGRARGVPHLG